jgi:hypothetical protein
MKLLKQHTGAVDGKKKPSAMQTSALATFLPVMITRLTGQSAFSACRVAP